MERNNVKILITGANGQLGISLQQLFTENKLTFLATDVDTLDISRAEEIRKLFAEFKPDFCINAAAYTNVDKAEEEVDKAWLLNGHSVGQIAGVCKDFSTKLIHISTDYVYGNNGNDFLTEDSTCTPECVYGSSKLAGEELIRELFDDYYIIRTSWLYSEYGHNFVKTMLDLGKSGRSLNVINDQFGAPTYAADLAKVIHSIINFNLNNSLAQYGTYNFSNEGITNWYEFANVIFELKALQVDITPVPSSGYKTLAKRPLNSRLSLEKIKESFGIQIPAWEESLQVCLSNL